MKRRFRKICGNNKGSALLSTFLVVVVLLLIAIGTLTLATASLQQSGTADNYERNYYPADRAVQQGIENIKRETLDYYNAMGTARLNTADLTTYNNMYNNFFSGVYSAAQASWQEPALQASVGSAPTGTTTTVLAPVRIDDNTYRFTVQSTAAGSKASRTLKASITITRNTVTYIPGSIPPPFGPEALITGGTLYTGGNTFQVTGNVRLGGYNNPNTNPYWDGFTADNKGTGSWLDPLTAASIGWNVAYPGYTTQAKTAATPSIPAIANGATVTSSSFPSGVPSPMYLEGQTGASFTLSSFGATGGQVYSTGALTVSGGSGFSGSSSNYMKFYSSGNMNIGSTTIGYVKIFCGGNLTLGGSLSGPVEIYCAGNVTLNGLNMNNCKVICTGDLTVSGGSVSNTSMYCKGNFNDNANDRTNVKYFTAGNYTMGGGNFVGNSLVYAEKKMYLESTCSGVFYTNGDVTLGSGAGITGQLVSRGDTKVTGSYTVKRSDAIVNAVLAGLGAPFITPGSTTEPQVVLPVNNVIFVNESTTTE